MLSLNLVLIITLLGIGLVTTGLLLWGIFLNAISIDYTYAKYDTG